MRLSAAKAVSAHMVLMLLLGVGGGCASKQADPESIPGEEQLIVNIGRLAKPCIEEHRGRISEQTYRTKLSVFPDAESHTQVKILNEKYPTFEECVETAMETAALPWPKKLGPRVVEAGFYFVDDVVSSQ